MQKAQLYKFTHCDQQQLNMFIMNPALNAASIPAMNPVMKTTAFGVGFGGIYLRYIDGRMAVILSSFLPVLCGRLVSWQKRLIEGSSVDPAS